MKKLMKFRVDVLEALSGFTAAVILAPLVFARSWRCSYICGRRGMSWSTVEATLREHDFCEHVSLAATLMWSALDKRCCG